MPWTNKIFSFVFLHLFHSLCIFHSAHSISILTIVVKLYTYHSEATQMRKIENPRCKSIVTLLWRGVSLLLCRWKSLMSLDKLLAESLELFLFMYFLFLLSHIKPNFRCPRLRAHHLGTAATANSSLASLPLTFRNYLLLLKTVWFLLLWFDVFVLAEGVSMPRRLSSASSRVTMQTVWRCVNFIRIDFIIICLIRFYREGTLIVVVILF